MEKNKSRTDMLAAGRKKLQQFRKKNQKGSSSSHAKSSGTVSKPENDGDPEEPSKLPEPQEAIDAAGPSKDHSVTAKPVGSSSAASVEDKLDEEELPTVSLDHQETNHSGSQECNGEISEDRKDGSDESIYDGVSYSERMPENLAPDSSSGVEVAKELDQPSLLLEGSDNVAEKPLVPDDVANEKDWRQSLTEDLEDKDGMTMPNTAVAQEATQSLFTTGGLQEGDANLFDTTKERDSFQENAEESSSSSNISCSNGEDGAVRVKAEEESGHTEEASVRLISGHGSIQEESGSSSLAKEVKVADADISFKAEDISSHEEGSAGLPLPHNFLAAEEKDDTVVLDQERDEKAMAAVLESARRQETIEPLMSEVHLEEDTDLSYRAESAAVEETSEIILSSSEATPAIGGDDGAVVTDVEDGGQNNGEHLQLPRRSQEVDRPSIPHEALYEVNTGYLVDQDKPEKTSYVEENMETVASSAEDSLVIKEEDTATIAGTGEEMIALEERVQQPSLVENAAAEPLEELPAPGHILFRENAKGIDKEGYQLGSFNGEAESIKQLLYLATVERDSFRSQLDEQIASNAEYRRRSSHDDLKVRDLVNETQDTKAIAYKELEKCMSELKATAIAKEQSESQCLSAKVEIEELQTRNRELLIKLEEHQEGLSHALVELADCRFLLETLQKENLDLTESLNSEKDARKEIIKEKEFLFNENIKLVSEVSKQKEQLSHALDKQVELQGTLRETGSCFEQLAEEDLYFAISLEVHKAKLKELDIRHLELPIRAKEYGNKGIMPSLQKDGGEDSDNSLLFRVLKQHLEGANNFLLNLEQSVDAMHSHTVSLSRTSGRAASPGISKIIQAFESKSQYGENVSDEMPSLIEGGRAEDSYASSKEQSSSLRDVLKQIDIELGRAETHLTKQQNNREYSNEVSEESEAQNQQSRYLQERIDELVNKVSDYTFKIVHLQNHIDEMQQNTNEEIVRLLTQLEGLKKEVNDMEFIFKQEKDSTVGVIVDAIEKLNASTGLHPDDGLDIGSHLATSVNAAVLAIKRLHGEVDAANLNYNTMQTSFEELNKSFVEVQGRNLLVLELLKTIYRSLREFVTDSYEEEALMDANTEESLHLLSGNCDLLIRHLQKLIDERHHLLSTNNELELLLLNRNHEIEELTMRCDALANKLEDERHTKEDLELILFNRGKITEEVCSKILSLVQKLVDNELNRDFDADSIIMKLDNMDGDFFKSTLLRLEALIDFLLQKHEEAIEQIKSSKTYLQEVNIFSEISADKWYLPLDTLFRQELVPKLSELRTNLQLLSASDSQQEAEIHMLKEGLHEMEEALEASRSEFNLKVSELEQSEQRLSSVREKLTIAVAKGKGLIVQRDSLKQSLVDKSSELEKCMQELQSKEALLHEVEAKLKSCSEVDRVEALESELSYIRNSATALRDSFLLKDSVLQRIEEVLEDLDLPEHFHSKDIVEKIELLSKLVASNSSFPVSDWDQKSSEGHAQSDAGFVIMDAWKDDTQPSSNQELDDLKRKYEELQSKFYSLAEHNDMLEQSLLERNGLVQKWEEMLDRIDMPSHLRTLEPEDRIQNLGRAISEIQQERDALQLKIENLEVSSDMLIFDLEESHKKISELSAEVVTVKSERDFFSESLEKLRFQYLALSEKAVHDEVEREDLQRELAVLQEKLVERAEDEGQHDVKNEIQKLHDLLLNALPDRERFETISEGSDIASLETSIRKLIDNYTVLSFDKSKSLDHKEGQFEESILSPEQQVPEDVLQNKDQELSALRLELDETFRSLVSVKEERDEAMEKCRSLAMEIEEVTRKMNLLQEEKNHNLEKYQSLELELKELVKSRDALQEQLSQEEQKSAAVREKLNVAVRKGKGLVQQRDALKHTIEEMNSMMERLKVEHNQKVEALESERSLLMNQLAESRQKLQEYSQYLNSLLTCVNAIDIGPRVETIDPVQKLEEIAKVSHHLHSAVISSENEARKSKQAAELLLAELNEVQDRVDILQEDLEKAKGLLAESYKQKNDAEAAKTDALSRLEHFMFLHSEERKEQTDNLLKLKSVIDELRKGCIAFSSILSDVFRKDGELFTYIHASFESILEQLNGGNVSDIPALELSKLLHINPVSNEDSYAFGDVWQLSTNTHFGDGLIAEHLSYACSNLHECTREYADLKDKVHQYLSSVRHHESYLSEIMEMVKRKSVSEKEHSELLKREVSSLEAVVKEKETEICSMHRNLSVLYEACRCSILEIENRKAQVVGSGFAPDVHIPEKSSRTMTLPSYSDAEEHADGHNSFFTDQFIRMMADSLLSTIQSSTVISEAADGNQRELKATVLDLQRELQEKDVEMKRIGEELVSQIRDAEAIANRSLRDLDSASLHIASLEKTLAEKENEKQSLDLKISELKDCQASLKELQDRVRSLTDSLAAKDQEIEGLKSGLMQALDEEESKMEALGNRNRELEDIIQEKIAALENLEASRAKALAKLSTTVSKFDELHNLSESLLAEIESLESQIKERDSEISFLRQEVTRSTNNDLASQETNKRYMSEMNEVLTWMEMMVSRFEEPHLHDNDNKFSQIHMYTDILGKRIPSLMNELEDLKLTAQSKDALLQIERGRVEELLQKTEDLKTMHNKEIHEETYQGEREPVQPSSSNSPGHVEIEQMVQRNKASSAPIVTHIRGGRKVNNDQVAIAIDMENADNVLDDEDDDKAHGFKSLTMSRLVPRATRPISDRIDGIWVSADRLLMRQPSLRLGVIMYWVLLHALLATII